MWLDRCPASSRGLSIVRIGAVLALSSLAAAPARSDANGPASYTVETVPLQVTRKPVTGQILLRQSIVSLAATSELAALTDNHSIWTMRRRFKPVPLAMGNILPTGVNWFDIGCAAGEQVVVSAARYSTQRREADKATARGGYVEGPQAAGILLISVTGVTPISTFKIVLYPDGHTEPPDSERDSPASLHSPHTLSPWIQTCAWDGQELVAGGYGFLAQLNLKSHEAKLLEYEDGDAFNRDALFLDGAQRWVSLDEGGLGGGCVERSGPQADRQFCLLNLSSGQIGPNSILRFAGRVLVSSDAGVVEIDEQRERYIDYQIHGLGIDPHIVWVLGLKTVDGQLLGASQEGLVRFDLEHTRATVIEFPKEDHPGTIRAFIPFDGGLLVAAEHALVKVKLPLP